MSKNSTVKTWVVGASGYVGAEFLRLVASHPHLELEAAFSKSSGGARISGALGHLTGPYPDETFSSLEEWPSFVTRSGPLVILCATPHGATAPLVAQMVERLTEAKRPFRIYDTSADFRFRDLVRYERIYGAEHAAPELCEQFYCGLPDLPESDASGRHYAHPGCFTTAVTLAAAPLVNSGAAGRSITVSAVTGSTGSGASPGAGTHHPERHGGFRAYRPLRHRHQVEMESLLRGFVPSGVAPIVRFIPHSGPFARGIHATLVAPLDEVTNTQALSEFFTTFYENSPFVDVCEDPPQLKHVVGTNRARIAVFVEGDTVVVTSVIDNLVKGAAGGALQWLNRSQKWDETLGLDQSGLGWT